MKSPKDKTQVAAPTSAAAKVAKGNVHATTSRSSANRPANRRGGSWRAVTDTLNKHYENPDIEAARLLCSALAAHALKDYLPAWCLAIAPPGSMKTDLLESFRGLPRVYLIDEVTTNTFLSGKVDEKGRKRKQPASWLHRIGKDGVLIVADFSTFTSDPKTLQKILAQLRRIYDGNFSREFGTDENMEERSWSGRLTFFAGAVPDVDRHYSLFQKLGERFVRARWPRAGGVEAGLEAMKHTGEVANELRAAVDALMRPILSSAQTSPLIPHEIELKIAHLGEFIALARTYIERDGYTREPNGVPYTEGNTRLPQQLSQIARGSALLDGRAEVNADDYKLVCRAAFDSLPPERFAVLQAIREKQSPFSIGLPKATTDRALEDLELSGVLTPEHKLSEQTKELLTGAGLLEGEPVKSTKPGVPESTPRYKKEKESSPTIPPNPGTPNPRTGSTDVFVLWRPGDELPDPPWAQRWRTEGLYFGK
jgi:hypothetical protein